jgi:hypothetical protein
MQRGVQWTPFGRVQHQVGGCSRGGGCPPAVCNLDVPAPFNRGIHVPLLRSGLWALPTCNSKQATSHEHNGMRQVPEDAQVSLLCADVGG